MGKLVKLLSFVIGLIILLVIIGVALLFALVHPNDLKPIIQKQVYQRTGRTLTINGDIHWSFYPSLGFKINNTTLSNPKSFSDQPFVAMKHATISIKLMPLLEKKIESNELIVDGLTINLIKNTKGIGNWQNMQPQQTVVTSSETQQASSKQSSSQSTSDFQLNIPQINFKNVTVNWNDLKTKQQSSIHNLNFQAKNIQTNHPFPIQLSMDINNNKPQVVGNLTASSDLLLNLESQKYALQNLQLKTKLSGKGISGNKMNADLKTTIKMTPNNLTATPIRLKLNDSTISGNLNINQFNQLMAASSKLRKLNMTGQFAVDKLTVNKINITNIQTSLNAKNGIIKLSPMTAKLYGGSYQGSVTINAKGVTPIISKQGKLTNINFNPLIKDLTGHDNFIGTGNLQFAVTMKSFDAKTIKRTLNGNASFNVRNGAIKGIDVAYYIRVARALIKKQMPPANKGANQTDFGSLTGTAKINNGVITCNNLNLASKTVEAHGQGSINLPANSIDYRIVAGPTGQLDDFSAPIMISGSLDNPKTSLDKDAILKAVIQKQFDKHKDKIREKIKEQLNDKLQDNLKSIQSIFS